jgi:hypothetical protein
MIILGFIKITLKLTDKSNIWIIPSESKTINLLKSSYFIFFLESLTFNSKNNV